MGVDFYFSLLVLPEHRSVSLAGRENMIFGWIDALAKLVVLSDDTVLTGLGAETCELLDIVGLET